MRLGGISYHWQGKGKVNNTKYSVDDEATLAKRPICQWHQSSTRKYTVTGRWVIGLMMGIDEEMLCKCCYSLFRA